MIGGLLRTTSLAALLAVGGLVGGMSQANAADLGGDCCADLEERVAELEATTARKGNRKVSLTVSGQVSELVYWWDDGQESNVYVGTSGYSSSRFRFKGDAKISADWSAGYYMELEVVSASAGGQTAGSDESGNSVNIRQSNWYLKSKTLGTLTVGQQSHATDDIVLYSLAGISHAAGANYNVAPGAGITFRGTTLETNDLFDFIDSDRANLVRYDSPTIAGFVLSASWGEDDMWDVALRYAGEFAGIKIAAGIGYHEERDIEGDITAGHNLGELFNVTDPDFSDVRGSISILHDASGLFGEFSAVHRDYDSARFDNSFYWSVRAGIYQKFFALGKTAIFGEYANMDHSSNTTFQLNRDTLVNGGLTDAEGTIYGVGLNQQIDAAAMDLFIGWRHMEADFSNNGVKVLQTDDIDTVYTGGRIQF